MAPASDLFSKLPDELLCFILSYVPMKEAVRSSILSQRWRYLYTRIPKLTVSPDLLIGPVIPDGLCMARVENIISNILLVHSSDLKTFDLYSSNDLQFSYENVWKWVQCVASKKVEHLSIRHLPIDGFFRHPFPLPPSLFSCNRLSSLILYDCILSKIPTGFGGFNHLTDCYFTNVVFRDDTLPLFISNCPLLEILELRYCYVQRKITISASNIKQLIFSLIMHPVEVLTLNCPKLTHLSCENQIKDLRVNGLLFQELSSTVQSLELQRGSNVIDMSLSLHGANINLSTDNFLEIMGTFKFLKKILFLQSSMDIPIINVLERLPHLERLCLYGKIFLHLTRDRIPTSLESPLLNLQMVDAYLEDYDEKEIGVLCWLLENCPALQAMDVRIPSQGAEKHQKYIQLLRRLLDSNFRRALAPARVRVTEYPNIIHEF